MKKWYKSKTFMGWFIIIVMVASTIGFALIQGTGQKTSEREYKGFKFYQQQGGWNTRINNQRFSFRYLPEELENISIGIINTGTNRIYIIYDPLDEELNRDYFYRRVGGILMYMDITPQLACDKDENCPNIPIRNCKDSSSMIYLKLSNESKTYNEDNCLVIEAEDNIELDRISERIMYKLLGIMG